MRCYSPDPRGQRPMVFPTAGSFVAEAFAEGAPSPMSMPRSASFQPSYPGYGEAPAAPTGTYGSLAGAYGGAPNAYGGCPYGGAGGLAGCGASSNSYSGANAYGGASAYGGSNAYAGVPGGAYGAGSFGATPSLGAYGAGGMGGLGMPNLGTPSMAGSSSMPFLPPAQASFLASQDQRTNSYASAGLGLGGGTDSFLNGGAYSGMKLPGDVPGGLGASSLADERPTRGRSPAPASRSAEVVDVPDRSAAGAKDRSKRPTSEQPRQKKKQPSRGCC